LKAPVSSAPRGMAPIRPQMRAFSSQDSEKKSGGFFDFLKVLNKTDEALKEPTAAAEEIKVDFENKTGSLESGLPSEQVEDVAEIVLNKSLSQEILEKDRVLQEALQTYNIAFFK